MKKFLKKIILFVVLFILFNFIIFYTLDNISSNGQIHKGKFSQITRFLDRSDRALMKKSYKIDESDNRYYIPGKGLNAAGKKEVENILRKSVLKNSVLDRLLPYKIWTGTAVAFHKFREISKFKNIDILFIGSSHAVLGFDPRIFQRYGLTSFNLAVRGQGPVNSYYLLKMYYKDLRPKIVIIECYFHSLVIDGFESFLYTLVNHPLHFNVLKMGIDAGGVDGIKAFFIEMVKRLRFPLNKYPVIKSGTYIPGGYATSNLKNDRNKKVKKIRRKYKLNPLQLNYYEKILHFCKKKGTAVFLVTHPLPDVFLEQVVNYEKISGQIAAVAKKHKVEYLDFNTIMKLDFYEDYKDMHHLNQGGVEKFNKKLINVLSKFDSFKALL